MKKLLVKIFGQPKEAVVSVVFIAAAVIYFYVMIVYPEVHSSIYG